MAWKGYHARLRHLLRYVDEAYLVAPDNTALVSSFAADSVPIGMPLHVLDQFEPELDSARTRGTATTRAFPGTDGRLYKWGFAELDDSGILLAVLMKADYLEPLARLRKQPDLRLGRRRRARSASSRRCSRRASSSPSSA